ncbi:MAG: site-specific tyrosine recombinase XerD [Alphaproteobacteria bacterium]|nr:site-specific tyrosine recombinase XerD [Alphaproteobacteria bacterium]
MPREIDFFLEALVAERGASPRTEAAYRRDLTDLFKFLTARGVGFAAAKKEDVAAYVRQLAQQRLSPKTQARRLSAIRSFYRFLYSEDVVAANPADYVSAPKIGRSLPKYLSEEEVARLIAGARTNARLYTLLEVLYASGMRVSELVGMPLRSLTRDNQTLFVVGKGNKERIVPLNAPARAALDAWLAAREAALQKGRASKWLFPSAGRTGHLTRDGFFKDLKALAPEAGIDARRVSPHVFRHSFASHLIAHDADLRSVQQMLGHADIATTEIYTHILQDRLQKVVEKSHPLAYTAADERSK